MQTNTIITDFEIAALKKTFSFPSDGWSKYIRNKSIDQKISDHMLLIDDT